MNTSFTRALICAFTIADAVFLVEAARAQGTFRTEVYPVQTVTLSTADFLLGKKDGKPATIAGELRIPKPGTDRYAQLPCDRCGLAIFFAEQEISSTERDRLHRINLGAEGALCPCRF